jgi:hypothetical protein
MLIANNVKLDPYRGAALITSLATETKGRVFQHSLISKFIQQTAIHSWFCILVLGVCGTPCQQLTCMSWHAGIPYVLRNGHVPTFLEAGEVNLVQWCGGDVNDLMQSGWMGWA